MTYNRPTWGWKEGLARYEIGVGRMVAMCVRVVLDNEVDRKGCGGKVAMMVSTPTTMSNGSEKTCHQPAKCAKFPTREVLPKSNRDVRFRRAVHVYGYRPASTLNSEPTKLLDFFNR